MVIGVRTKSKQVWQGAVVLTIAAIISKLLSAAYRVPYQNLAGDIGYYIYQQVYPIYGIAFALSTYGFPVILSRLLAERYEEDDLKGIKRILIIASCFLLLIGTVSFSLLYFGANFIANFMGDSELVLLLKIIAFSFLLLPFISLLRGYFQGQNNMRPTAISQIVEQTVRTATIILITYLFITKGYDVYQTGAGAVFGSLLSGISAIFILVAFLFRQSRSKRFKKGAASSNIKASMIIKILIRDGITICITGMLLMLFQLVDALSLFSLLSASGMTDIDAKSAKGIYDRGQPLIQLGTVVATSLSLSLVPLISSARIRNDFLFIQEKIHLALRVSVVVGVGAAVGLALVMESTNIMLFENNLGTNVLIVLSFSIFFTSIILTISSILQGLGHPILPAIAVFLGVVLKWGLNDLLIPMFHTMGAAVASLIAYLIMVIVLYVFLKTKITVVLMRTHLIRKIPFAILSMMISLTLFFYVTEYMFIDFESSRLFSAIKAIMGVLFGGIVYLIMIVRGNIFTEEELLLIPFGEKLVIFLRKKAGDEK